MNKTLKNKNSKYVPSKWRKYWSTNPKKSYVNLSIHP